LNNANANLIKLNVKSKETQKIKNVFKICVLFELDFKSLI